MVSRRLSTLCRLFALGLFTLALAACPRGAAERPYPEPATADVVDYLRTQNDRAESLNAETLMDYWFSGERVRGTVLLMGERGAKVRINALTAGDAVAADLACDGATFTLLDYGDDCAMSGPCDARSIGQLLGVYLEPDELLLLSLGSVPLLAEAEIAHRWDDDRGAEEIVLTVPGGPTQRIYLERSGAEPNGDHWDVVASVLENADGRVQWELENRDFETVQGADGTTFRAPARSRFQQPAEDADLAVRWEEREANTELNPAAFHLDVPAGLPTC